MKVSKTTFYSLILFLLWFVYVIYRSINGLNLISDETFYFNQIISEENKRIFFLKFVQFFSDKDLALFVVLTTNIISLLIAYIILVRVFLYDHIATFFLLFYFSAISAYVFRDTLLLLLFSLLLLYLHRSKYIINLINIKEIKNLLPIRRLFTFNTLLLVLILYLLYDFRSHFIIIIGVAWLVSVFLTNIRNNYFAFAIILISIYIIYIFSAIFSEKYMIYGVSAAEFIETREERWGISLDSTSFITSLLTHYFAPIPTSLLERIYTPELQNSYGVLDDIYRLVYKSFIYYVVIYILFNYKYLRKSYKRWKQEIIFLSIFSISNAVIYSLYSFGGGHERVKVFSVFFLVFIFSSIRILKKEKLKNKKHVY